MSYLAWAVPVALLMGLAGLAAFMWSLRSGQYEDLDGAAERVLLDDEGDVPTTTIRPPGPDGNPTNSDVGRPWKGGHALSP